MEKLPEASKLPPAMRMSFLAYYGRWVGLLGVPLACAAAFKLGGEPPVDGTRLQLFFWALVASAALILVYAAPSYYLSRLAYRRMGKLGTALTRDRTESQ